MKYGHEGGHTGAIQVRSIIPKLEIPMKDDRDKKTAALLKTLVELGHASGKAGNYVVNVAALVKYRDQIEKAYGSTVEDGDLFKVVVAEVMAGGVLILTDESTTGQAVSVEFQKKVTF
jgi:hypothetical protein